MNTKHVTETVKDRAAKDYRMAEIFQEVNSGILNKTSKKNKLKVNF